MALPQGINFRATSGYVTDGANEDYEIATASNYPRTSAQGNNVGWETTSSAYQTRNRTTLNDSRLAGLHFNSSVLTVDYRIDLAASGSHNIRCAFGDKDYSWSNQKLEIFDTSSSLGVLFTGASTGAANSFLDAGGTARTAAAWPGSNTAANLTFSTTICRFRCGDGTNVQIIAHLYVESAGGGGYTLTAAQGSYSLTGQAAALRAARKLAAAQGSYSLTGQAAGLKRGLMLAAAQGSYALTGQAAGIRLARNLAAAQGTYTLTGQAAALRLSRRLTAAQGSYGLTGNAVGLTYSASGAKTLIADCGTYTLTGQAVSLTVSRRIAAAQGAYALTGFAALLTASRRLAAAFGTYTLTGQAASLIYTGVGITPVYQTEPRWRFTATGGARRVGFVNGSVEEGRLGAATPQPGTGRLGDRSA